MNTRFLHSATLSKLRTASSALLRGVAVFEMTVLTLTASVILIILAQGTLLFTQASAVRNLAHLGSSYAAANPAYDGNTVRNFVLQNAPGVLGANGGSALNVTVNPSTAPRNLASAVTVTVAFTCPYSRSFGSSFFGLNFPTTLTASDTGATQ